MAWVDACSLKGILVINTVCWSYANAAQIQYASGQESSSDSDSFENTATIVVACTFSLGLVVGGLWCYCMSAVCGTRQPKYKQPRLSAPTRRHDYVTDGYPRRPRTEYSSESPTPSDLTTRSPSPPP